MNEIVKGYSTFQEIENNMLRAYNQYNVLTNLRENKLLGVMEEYINSLSKTDRIGLALIVEYINAKGIEETKREIIESKLGLEVAA